MNDAPDSSPASFFASKSLATSPPDQRRKQVTAIVIQERGAHAHANIVRFFYYVQTGLGDAIHSWVAVPR